MARTLIAYVGIATIATSTNAHANAAPMDDPCPLAASLFCQFLPVAPGLDGDVDLTQQPPPVDRCGDDCPSDTKFD